MGEANEVSESTSAMAAVTSALNGVAEQVAQDLNTTQSFSSEEEQGIEEQETSVPAVYKRTFDLSSKLRYLKGLEKLPGVEGSAAISEREETLTKLSASMYKSLSEFVSQARIRAL